jgi:PAS domain S-box-containing protein
MASHYDLGLVTISVVIAILASYAGLLFAGHVTSVSGRPRLGWLGAGAVVMGLGIWSMHFVGMIAFQLPVPIGYGLNLILVSVAVAIAASLLALLVVSGAELRPLRLLSASVLMGAAIIGMHYIGMAAMSAPVQVTYQGPLVALSVLIAIVASFAGLWLAFRFRSDVSSGATLRKAASAVVMGVAISGMHYTGMAAARFAPGAMRTASGSHVLASTDLGEVIAVSTLVIIMLGIVGSALERRRLAERAARTEDALRASEERWRNLFENAPVGIALTGSRGHYVAANPVYQRMVGYSEAELQRLTPADITHEDDRADTDAVLAAHAAGQLRTPRFEKRYRRKDGSLIWAEMSAFLVPLAGSTPLLGGVMVDITERKGAEEALRIAQAELARAARLTTMGELAASIAHEINQPLAAIVMNGSAALRWLSQDAPDLDEARGALERVVNDGKRAGDVIHGLRSLAGKSGPQLTTLDIDDVIQEVLALAHGEVEQHGVVLHTDLSTGDRPVLGDRVQLQQVLLNLILNGIDAMKAVTDRPRELAVSSALAEPGSILVSVEDTGTGLDPAVSLRIFEPFVTTKSDGLGMGLSICRSIIDAHGGRLWVSPRVPHGTALRFTVPTGADA